MSHNIFKTLYCRSHFKVGIVVACTLLGAAAFAHDQYDPVKFKEAMASCRTELSLPSREDKDFDRQSRPGPEVSLKIDECLAKHGFVPPSKKARDERFQEAQKEREERFKERELAREKFKLESRPYMRDREKKNMKLKPTASPGTEEPAKSKTK